MVSPRVTAEFHTSTVLLARLAPPGLPARMLRRPRVEKLFAEALEYPLGALVAPVGSGKSLALAQFALYGGWPLAWCRLSTYDDPSTLLRHLAAAFRPIAALDEAAISAALQATSGEGGLSSALDLLVNDLAASLDDETLLVLDAYEQADGRPELRTLIERLIGLLPLRLHVLFLTRVTPKLAALANAQVRGELFELGQADLAFTVDEAVAFFALTGHPLPADLPALVEHCRGWPLALRAALGGDWRVALGLWEPHTADLAPAARLDDYLEREVIAELPDPLCSFLLHTALLRQIDPDAAEAIVGNGSINGLLSEARRRQLFIDEEPGGRLIYQPLFHAFLSRLAQRRLSGLDHLHRRAAEHYRDLGEHEGALHHLLAAGDSAAAAAVLSQQIPAWLAANQAATALAWIERLPSVEREHPRLIELRAATLRRMGRFETALQSYAAAEAAFAKVGDLSGQVRVLRGQAEIYLDTVQPAPAVAPLKRALKLLPREHATDRAALLRLQAENWANRGRADVALILEAAAGRVEQQKETRRRGARETQEIIPLGTSEASQEVSWSPSLPVSPSALPPRLLLRSGRLNEARQQLETELWSEATGHTGTLMNAHREPLLLLALIHSLLGSGSRALALARRGLLEAQQSAAPLTEAIARMRLGHAYQLVSPGDTSLAQNCYLEALKLIQQVGVNRTRAEGYLGLTLIHGHSGDLLAAEGYANEGLLVAQAAGDEWMVALIQLALGGAAVAADAEQALNWLAQARQRFVRGGDSYGELLTLLWQALYQIRSGASEQAGLNVAQLLDLVARHGYEGVLTGTTLFGPRDMAMLVPLLLHGRALPAHAARAGQLLRAGFPTIAADETVEDYYPGYTLRVQMLGTFRVWRGWHEIQAREWQREKARQLFQLLLTYRGHWLQREQICLWLWPDSDLEAAERQFKVTLNALNTALEPARPARTSPFFIRRQGLAYSFAPSYGVWIDVDEFELRVAGATAQAEPDFARRNSQAAVQLYKGDYLAEALYDSWTSEERERLLARYLAAATAQAARLTQGGDYAEAIQLCERVLRRDHGYEEAYQVLILAHAQSGSRSQALRSYARCVQALHDDLGIEPLTETTALYERLKRNEA